MTKKDEKIATAIIWRSGYITEIEAENEAKAIENFVEKIGAAVKCSICGDNPYRQVYYHCRV